MSETAQSPDLIEKAEESVDSQDVADDSSIRNLLADAIGDDPDVETPPETAEAEAIESSPPRAETPTGTEDRETAAPQSWTEAEREAWSEMSAGAQAAVLRRESEIQARLQAEARLAKVVEPLAEQLKGAGVHADDYIQALIQADRYISQNPAQAVQALIDRHQLQDRFAPSESEYETPAPDDRALGEVQRLRQELAYERQVQAAREEWSTFSQSHPDAERLKDLMAAELRTDTNLDYAGAYAKARDLVQAAGGVVSDAAAEQSRIEGQASRGQAARKLKLPAGKAAGGQADQSTGDLRDDIRKALRQGGIMK